MPPVDSVIRTELASVETAESPAFRPAKESDAADIVQLYERVFGTSGIKAIGHEAYPAPDVFCTQGVRKILANPSKLFLVGELRQQLVSGMLINFLSPYNCEFACVAVDPRCRDMGISPRMLMFARAIAGGSSLSINATEIVTHSVMSQSAHSAAGYGKVIGFGYCQYPRVFFANHPESCLWVCSIDGRVAQALRRQMPDSRMTPVKDLTQEELRLRKALETTRKIFVPNHYRDIAGEILAQFTDTLDYRLMDNIEKASDARTKASSESHKEDPFGYLILPTGVYPKWQDDVAQEIESIKSQGKRYIQARIPANDPSSIIYAEHLRSLGFVLLGILPLYLHRLTEAGTAEFDDLLVQQWISRETLCQNALPGETDSVIKIHGYPANLSGRLLKVIRQELAQTLR